MTDADPYTTDRGITVRRGGDSAYNYEILARDTGEVVARVSWVTLHPSGTPIALGDAPAELELGSNTTKRIEWAGVYSTSPPSVVASGARVFLGDDA